jgi:hypothetical protein
VSSGWEGRLAILRRDAEQSLLSPLRTHGWTAMISREVEQGEYLIIEAERAGYRHQIALMYTSATANSVYKDLAPKVEHIFIKGQLYKLNAYAYGIETPISEAADFHDTLLKWNAMSSDGKFAPTPVGEVQAERPKHSVLLSETPIHAIWLRLRQAGSVTLAKKLIEERAANAGSPLDDDALRTKAEGLAYSLRNATDYFHAKEDRNVSQRILNLYYGSLAFAFAEMLAEPGGPKTLGEIEDSTKRGHGLYTVDGASDGLQHLVVGVIASGFFPTWMRFLGLKTDDIPSKKPRKFDDLTGGADPHWITVEQLFARIPEVADLFEDIFDSPPGWAIPIYDSGANKPLSLYGNKERPTRSYIQLIDHSTRLTKDAIARVPGPITEITEVASKEPGRHFRLAVDHPGKDHWHEVLPVHHSPFTRSSIILPVFGSVGTHRAICVVLLYALSIVVRYRPSVWRRVQEGDLDHMRVLIEAFLEVVERVLPQAFLEQITGRKVYAKQPGDW